MANTDEPLWPNGLKASALTVDSLTNAQQLVTASGWNQTSEDWHIFLELGHAFQVSTPDNVVVATAATLPYPPHSGWISMVLVNPSHLRQGIASTLLRLCIQTLTDQELSPWLDATNAGRAVYLPLGFGDEWSISRWRLAQPALKSLSRSDDIHIRPLSASDWPQVTSLDLMAFGADRTQLLERLHARSEHFACVAEKNDQIIGFLLGRNGRTATQMGPVVALDAHISMALLDYALARETGSVMVDAVDAHVDWKRHLQNLGFQHERDFMRMSMHATKPSGHGQSMFAIAGPELG
jgi:ribosomal protein S18 acetylase RimI-like enzyme